MHPHMDMHICTNAKMQIKVYTVCKMTREKKKFVSQIARI